jgi:hypothetical protein
VKCSLRRSRIPLILSEVSTFDNFGWFFIIIKVIETIHEQNFCVALPGEMDEVGQYPPKDSRQFDRYRFPVFVSQEYTLRPIGHPEYSGPLDLKSDLGIAHGKRESFRL